MVCPGRRLVTIKSEKAASRYAVGAVLKVTLPDALYALEPMMASYVSRTVYGVAAQSNTPVPV